MTINILRFDGLNPITSYMGAYSVLRLETVRTGVEIPEIPDNLVRELKKLNQTVWTKDEWAKMDQDDAPIAKLASFIQEKIIWLSARTNYFVPVEERNFSTDMTIVYMMDIIESDVAAMNSLYGMLRAVKV